MLQAGSMKMTIKAGGVRLVEDAESAAKRAAKQQMTRVIAHSRAGSGQKRAGHPGHDDRRGGGCGEPLHRYCPNGEN